MSRKVYFIKPVGFDGPIKIGCSALPVSRRDALAHWSPFPLEILAEIEGGLSLERRFHYHFHAWHEHREWFTATPELLTAIAAINAGTFDVSSLTETPTGSGWRARHQQPSTNGKQASLTRRAYWAEYLSGTKCPVRYHRAFVEGRHADIEAAEAFIAAQTRRAA
jgi:hypothetical protein